MTRASVILGCLLLGGALLAGCNDKGKDADGKDTSARRGGQGSLGDLKVGMTLSEVEGVLGKGTMYADVDRSKVKLGFSIADEDLQRNTYVWPRGKKVIVVTFGGGKLVRSMEVTPPE